MKEEKKSKIEESIKEINKKFGSGTVINGSDFDEYLEVVDSGSLTLNIATNINGIPIGKLIEMQGQESAGKSTVSLHIISNFQKAGKLCALIDQEQAYDKQYATSLGVDSSKLLIAQPDCQEDAYNIIIDLIKAGVNLVVFDSHTSSMPRKVIDGEVGDATIGLQARINSTALGKVKPLLMPNKCTLLAISQLRTNIGGYGDPNVSTGGMAYKFYSDMRFKVSKQLDKANENNKTTVEVIKNKCGSPFGKAEFLIQWGEGIDRLQEIIDLAVEYKFINKGGAGWYTIETSDKIQGDINLKNFLNDNPEFKDELEKKVLDKIYNK